jgi:hypothetical protein
MKLSDDIPVKGNVRITVRKAGKIIDVLDDHNIFLDQGREWLAALSSGRPVFGHAHPQIVAYMGFGTGGQLQDVQAFRSAQTENSGVTDLATLVDLTDNPAIVNLAAIAGDVTSNPPPTTVRFTRIITESEISFPGGPTGVPLSEFGLYMIETAFIPFFPSHPDIDITTPPNTPKLVAYQQRRTITKTDELSLQVDWELRF